MNDGGGSVDKDMLFLREWISHKDESFHDLQETYAIRKALVDWYRENRRKLPWRGDPPPFTGSTAKSKTTANKKKNNEQISNGASIKDFFKPTKSNTSKKKDEENEESKSEQKALPITGYGVWVSEIMLQQTRVEAVIPYYIRWMESFPTVHHLANATEDEVNAHWAGLGYYRRARMLRAGAQCVVEQHDGELPQTVPELLQLEGIGPYTASAIASIAFGQKDVAVVDGNVCRVLCRLCGIANHIKDPVLLKDKAWKLAQQLLFTPDDNVHSGEVNQAMMELGATHCSPSSTGTDPQDPLRPFYLSTRISRAVKKLDVETLDQLIAECEEGSCGCRLCCDGVAQVLGAYKEMKTKQEPFSRWGHGPFPLPPPKALKREEVLAVAVLSVQDSTTRYLLIRRRREGLLAGQWEFPSVCVWSSSNDKKKKNKALCQIPSIEPSVRSKALNEFLQQTWEKDDGNEWWSRRCVSESSLEHVFSHVRHTYWVEHATVLRQHHDGMLQWIGQHGREVRWMSQDDMKEVGVTAGVKKILKSVSKPNSKRKR